MGSTKPKEVLNEKEVSMLLNRPRSQLAEIWKRDALSQWASTLNEPPKTYAPTSHIQKKVSEVILSGEKCNQCKTRRKKCIGVSLYRILFSKKRIPFAHRLFCILNTLKWSKLHQPLRQIIRDNFRELKGSSFSITFACPD